MSLIGTKEKTPNPATPGFPLLRLHKTPAVYVSRYCSICVLGSNQRSIGCSGNRGCQIRVITGRAWDVYVEGITVTMFGIITPEDFLHHLRAEYADSGASSSQTLGKKHLEQVCGSSLEPR